MSDNQNYAFGWPGIAARWTSSAKNGIGTAIGSASRVWFTLSHGILNEVYYPRIDQACTRDLGLVVTDGNGFFSEEKRHTRTEIEYIEPATPAFRIVNSCQHGTYRIVKEIITDATRDVVLQRIKFTPLVRAADNYRVHVLLSPHLGNRGAGNTGWCGDYKGRPMLFAERDGIALALAASTNWNARSVGFVGQSDGWQDLAQHHIMTWQFERAENGNIALTGELDWRSAPNGTIVLALGFGDNASEAGHRALASLLDDFDGLKEHYLRGWRSFHQSRRSSAPAPASTSDLEAISAMVLRVHEAKTFPGGLIASLSIPWGFNKGDDDLGGYHLVWPRDLVESAGGLLAVGARSEAHRVFHYLMATQEADGHWSQNMWLNGSPYWSGTQMDETAFPILLADLAMREKAVGLDDVKRFWPMLRKAAQFLACNGPVTQQDRWEEDPGYSPFTLAVEIAALLVAADLAEASGETLASTYLRETADAWNASIERWTYVSGTALARRLGIDGYYVRIAPPEVADGSSPAEGFIPIKNRPIGQGAQECDQIIGPDALALVRFGLRSADDPRIANTVKAIDTLLKVDTPWGPVWHRYNDDGYGEHEDGSPFDGTGVGRGWPLLTGERGHFELAAGRFSEAAQMLKTMEGLAGETGLIPEQTWDTNDIPARELRLGRPSGSAMPLVWAHSEYLKLKRSLEERRVFDMPAQTVKRYQIDKVQSPFVSWRFNHKCRCFEAGKKLRIETLGPVLVHWSSDEWYTSRDSQSRNTGIGVYVTDLDSQTLAPGARIVFTLYWPQETRWEGVNYSVDVVGG